MISLGSLGEKQLRGALVLLLAALTVATFKIVTRPLQWPYYSSTPSYALQSVMSSALQVYVEGKGEGIYFLEGEVTVIDVLRAAAPRKSGQFEGDVLHWRLLNGDRVFISFNPLSVRREPMEQRVRLALGMPMEINSASQDDLVMISGIGPATAEAIVKYREERGGFTSIRELTSIRGIGEKRFQELERYLTLDRQKGWLYFHSHIAGSGRGAVW
ncbi:MAG: helix-hairpin-helix domain-containing protein [Syntrophales bacterium]|nr:helix-hairpin-helix domain-containing protein [Syntrophales bacterium]